nr:fibrous sheath CABYR-binding protein-like [Quercus suber]
MAELEGAKNVADWARDEALRAKEEVEFTRTEAEASKEKAKEVAYDLGVAETLALLKSQVLEAAPSSSKAEVVPEEVGTTPNKATLAFATSDEPTKEPEPAGVAETDKGPNEEAPQDATKSSSSAQAPNAEEAPLQVDPP